MKTPIEERAKAFDCDGFACGRRTPCRCYYQAVEALRSACTDVLEEAVRRVGDELRHYGGMSTGDGLALARKLIRKLAAELRPRPTPGEPG